MYSQDFANEQTARRFQEVLASFTDIAQLEALAQNYAPYEEISIPAHQRLCDLDSQNLERLVALGFAWYMNGRDEQAQDCATRALEIDRGNISALNLQAALAKDDATKRSIYARILTIDPHNRAAFDNLVLIRATSEPKRLKP